MSIANFGDLKTAIGTNYLNRSDLSSYIPDFVTLAESRIFYGSGDPYASAPLRVPAMQTNATGTIASNAIAFPTRFLEIIRLAAYTGSNGWTLDYLAPSKLAEAQNSAMLPTKYTYLNNQIQTAGTGAATYSLDYYQAFASLSADADTNWLLTTAPQVYLFAALMEAAPFIQDQTQITAWFGLYKSAISSLNLSTNRRASGSLVSVVVQ